MKKMYLRILAVGLAMLLSIGFVSCNIATEGPATEPDTTESVLILPPTDAPTEEPTEAPTEAPTEVPAPEPVKHEIKNIILIIGDGMGIEHISAGELPQLQSILLRSL